MKLSKYLYFAVISLSIFLIGCSGSSETSSGMNSAPNETVKQFYTYLDQGDIGAASRLVSRNAVNKQGSLKSSPTELAANIKTRSGLKSVDIQKEDGREVVATVNYKNGTNETFTHNMVQEDRDWKIDSLK